ELLDDALLSESATDESIAEARGVPAPADPASPSQVLRESPWLVTNYHLDEERLARNIDAKCSRLLRTDSDPRPGCFAGGVRVSVHLPGLLGQQATPSLTLEAVTADKCRR